MMDDTARAQLEQLLAKHETKPGTQGWLQCCCETPTLLYESYADWARHVREDLEANYLVVPYVDVVATEYAYSPAPGYVQLLGEQAHVAWTARNDGGEALERPVLAWSPTVLPEGGTE